MDKHSVRPPKPIPAHVLRHLTEQPKSAKSIKAYCKDAGISTWSFYNWRSNYGTRIKVPDRPHTTPKLPLQFTALGPLSAQRRQPLFDIRFSAGTRISIYSGATAQELAPFLDLLSCRDGVPC